MLITDKINVYRVSCDWFDLDLDNYCLDVVPAIGVIDCGIDTFREQFREWVMENETVRTAHVRKVCTWPEYLAKHKP